MTFMVWSEDLMTGIPEVDRQHRGLVDLLNEAAPMLARADIPPGPDASEPIPEDLRRSLERMAALLAASDTRADELMRQLLPRLRPCLGPRLDTLAGRIAAFDYEQALLLLRDLLNDPAAGARP